MTTEDPFRFFRKQLRGHTIIELLALHATATDREVKQAIDEEMERRQTEGEAEKC